MLCIYVFYLFKYYTKIRIQIKNQSVVPFILMRLKIYLILINICSLTVDS